MRLSLECWWFIAYMLGMNLGESLHKNRYGDAHCFLVNDTEIPFITSDQPVVNVYKEPSSEMKPPEPHECDFYYPISPSIAYMINSSNRFPSGIVKVTADIAHEINVKVAKRSNYNIIGSSKEALIPYKAFVGSNLRLLQAARSNPTS